MNNQEAITLLRNLEDSLDSYCELNEKGKTVFRMAIEALNCSEIPNNSDIISRQAVKDIFTELYSISAIGSIFDKCEWADICETTANELPPVQPEHKIGRWILTANGRGRHECSRCHEYAPCYQDGSEHLSTFCVLCGAKMEEGK